MSPKLPDLDADSIRDALHEAVKRGWVVPVEHGYCFTCSTEGPVFEITAREAPTQPAKCEGCFVAQALTVIADPLNLQRLAEGFLNEPS